METHILHLQGSQRRAGEPAAGLELQVVLYLAGMALLWTLLCGISHRAPDLDGLEELVWASSLELGYTKHPPAPSWLMYFLTRIFGRPVWLPFFAGQLMSALALWFLWRLGREFTTPRKAFMAMMLVSVSIYFSLRGTIYNHNTAQLWSVAASTWLLYRALKHQRLSSWAWLGVVSGLSIQTKYSAVIQFTAFFLFMLRQGSFRDARNLKGLALALLTFAVTISPHLYWLASNAFMPLRYADNSLEAGGHLQALGHLLSFALDQLARLSPMLVAWLAWHAWNKRRPVAGAGTAAMRYGAQFTEWDRSFLLWIGLAPVLSTMLVSAVLGTRLVASWGTTFFVLYGFYLLWWMRGDERVNLRRIAVLCIALHVLMAVSYALARGPLAWHTGRDSRSTFPGAVISQQLNDIWQRHVPGHPLTLVASDTWLGGNIAIHRGPEAQVFINGKPEESPWLDEAPLACGALVVYSLETRGEPDPVLKALHASATIQGRLDIPWSSEKSPLIDLNWGIIPPGERCAAKGHARR
ncbi:glycosyltransferase family 39 protein [Parapusillimonas granuli]|uniref:Glycosyltransferase family 39 protein n=1 Tax=Parapusillimonas granuli TaxID=380911 RepID=A0A853G1D1_9BURK|nr:glycosyltransferase family 39 protein [Parapusillimonas granuli]MBB5217130.1 hypothetical protein [Parapusillimonas granuli]NYT50107.1 glycosyltransferase family 39 protein [Parapusillimonas granuli]